MRAFQTTAPKLHEAAPQTERKENTETLGATWSRKMKVLQLAMDTFVFMLIMLMSVHAFSDSPSLWGGVCVCLLFILFFSTLHYALGIYLIEVIVYSCLFIPNKILFYSLYFIHNLPTTTYHSLLHHLQKRSYLCNMSTFCKNPSRIRSTAHTTDVDNLRIPSLSDNLLKDLIINMTQEIDSLSRGNMGYLSQQFNMIDIWWFCISLTVLCVSKLGLGLGVGGTQKAISIVSLGKWFDKVELFYHPISP
mgnify:CR=1 FL=1